jgi:hypothetical protein
MTLEKLYKLLEMDGPEDMEYFEQFADLMDMDEDVPFDLFYMALSGVKPENAGELAENYFEDLSNAAPEDENDLVLLLDSLEENLMHLAEDIDDADARRSFAEQLYKFREWYKAPGGAEIDGEKASVFEALLQARSDAISGETHELAFLSTDDYKLEDASYGLGKFSKIDIAADGTEDAGENADEKTVEADNE